MSNLNIIKGTAQINFSMELPNQLSHTETLNLIFQVLKNFCSAEIGDNGRMELDTGALIQFQLQDPAGKEWKISAMDVHHLEK